MTHRFTFEIHAGGTEIRLLGHAGPVPVDLWPVEAPGDLLPGVDIVQRLVAAGSAITDADLALLDHASVAGLTAREAAALGLPPVADAVAAIETRGVITRPDFTAELSWQRSTGQPILGVERTGAWLRIGGAWRRLPDALFDVAEAVNRLRAAGGDQAERLAALGALREVLPAAQETGGARTSGLIGSMTIAHADAFSLDLEGEGAAARLVPILHRARDPGDAPLLAPEQQQAFGRDQFNRFGTARPIYALGDGSYLVLSPPLLRALQEVRRVQSAPLATRRALLAAPRAFLRQALGDEVDPTVVEGLFRETQAYAGRVIGLGIWHPRVVPWVPLGANDWFGPEAPGGSDQPRPRAKGLMVGDRAIPLDAEAAEALRQQVENAIGAGRPSVPLTVGGETVAVPATVDTLTALRDLQTARDAQGPRQPPPEREALIIAANEEAVEHEGEFTPRTAPDLAPPRTLCTPLKAHQREGLEWLQRSWAIGRPGVLLADDMGLGKTLQGLAFLAWLREGMDAGSVARAPLLIVAPTGLLENWRAEHDRHLASPGLGRCLQAYGRGLAAIRSPDAEGRPAIDLDALRRADWVLTTYETLRDHDRDFGQVRFAALLFDEVQKIKTPGVRITDAAKAMNAEFRVAMSGTPVENRLADLWCIVDAVHPACLGDLKAFSAEYERSADAEELKRLKASLDRWRGRTPPLLLRRLKEDRLPDLPPREDNIIEAEMPAGQAAAYLDAIAAARGAQRRGAVLEALQALRRISLHPGPEAPAEDKSFIAASARLSLAFRALDRVAGSGERALIFLDDLALQARLAGLIQRRYRLTAPPMIISGSVDGASRQSRVDRFQSAPDGFDAMILSPRAGGVGLTLTRANHVVHLSRWWNPAVEDQCTGRAMRIGQTRPVTVHIPLALLPDGRRSFDQNLHALLDRKRQLMRDALLPPAADDRDREALFAATVGDMP